MVDRLRQDALVRLLASRVSISTSAAGAGVTDDGTGRGLTGSVGFGMKIYIGQWFGLRLDVRDHVLSQEILGVSQIVNDIVTTAGFSVFLPFSG